MSLAADALNCSPGDKHPQASSSPHECYLIQTAIILGGKPRIKCGDCSNRLLIPLSDAVIYDHLAGEHTVGVYPLLDGDTCHFLAVDFDEADWREDAQAFIQSCTELGVSAALEISRSGQGAHACQKSSAPR